MEREHPAPRQVMSTMSPSVIGFDPYIAWLSVGVDDRPLNPYQLLNLETLEANPSKISAAVVRQRQALEIFRAGAPAELWERIRDELEQAIKQLSDGDRKALLDARIIRHTAAAKRRETSGHKAPAGPLIGCRQCQKENASQRRFCGDCGGLLWDACGSCGAEVPVDERFCGICGANLVDTASAEIEQAEARLAEARRLAEHSAYEDAIAIARKLARTHDPRLDDLADEALALLAHVELQLASRAQEAADALDRAKELLSGFAYDGAIAELSEVPERFLTDEMRQTLADATARRNEVRTLSGDIRAALEAQKTAEVLPKLERLLTLKPGHDQAQKLAVQLRERLVASAKTRLQDHRYSEASALLYQVPSFVRTAEAEKLQQQAQELQWFVDDLRHAPQADATLGQLADRFVKIAPQHPEAAPLQQQVAARLAQELPSEPRHRYHAWAAAPKQSHVGWPIDWLTGFQNMRVPDAAQAQLLAEHPGRFFVALGLALQGLDKAPLDLNLVPQEKKFSLKQIGTLLRKRGDKCAWGLDLSASGLKAVKLQCEEKGGGVIVADAAFLAHRKLLSQPHAELERGAIIGETLQAFLAGRSLSETRIVANVPSHKMLGRYFDLPPLELKKVADTVEYEARHQIPFNLDDLFWDWSLVAARDPAEHEEPRRIVVVAGRDYHVTERLGSLKEAGIQPHLLTTDGLALHNFLLHEFFGAAASHDAVVAIDVGAEYTNLVVTSPSVHWQRSLAIGGDHLSDSLVKQFKLTYAQAELLKREPYRARRMSTLYQAIAPLLESLAEEIIRSLDSFLQLYPDQTLSRIYGLGGGFALHGLWRKLRSGK